jgi:hypothetical protein
MARMSILLAALGWLIVVLPAEARKADIGGVAIEFPAPEGYCDLERERPQDAKLWSTVEAALAGANQLLAMSVDCKQLDDWRAGNRPYLDDLAQYQTRADLAGRTFPDDPEGHIRQICQVMRSQSDSVLDQMKQNITERVEKALEGVKHSGISNVGVLGEDPGACFWGVMQSFALPDGSKKVQAALTAFTLQRGKLVYLYLFSPYVGPETFDKLLGQQRAAIVRFNTANKP